MQISDPATVLRRLRRDGILTAQCHVPSKALIDDTLMDNRRALRHRSQLAAPITILTIGSSSTSGAGASSAFMSYPSQLKRLLGLAWPDQKFEVVNKGVGGETAAVTATRLLTLTRTRSPDVIVWQVGANDVVTRVALKAFRATLRTTLATLREARRMVLLTGLQHSPLWVGDDHYHAIRRTLRAVARKNRVPFIRRHDAMVHLVKSHPLVRYLARDNFHLNDAGYRCMAEHVLQGLVHLFRFKGR